MDLNSITKKNAIFYSLNHVPFRILNIPLGFQNKNHLIECLHLLFVLYNIYFEAEDTLFLFIHEKEEVKDSCFNKNEILLEHNQDKIIKIRVYKYGLEK